MNNINKYNSMTDDQFREKYQFEEDLSGLGHFNDDQTYFGNKGEINNFLFSNEENKNETNKEKN